MVSICGNRCQLGKSEGNKMKSVIDVVGSPY